MRSSISLMLLLLTIPVSLIALDPPARLWEMQYNFPDHSGCFFYDIELTSDGNHFITGVSRDFQQPDSTGHCAFLIDPDGNLIWEVNFNHLIMQGNDGIVLADGSMVITGYSIADYISSKALFIMKIDQSGTPVWTKTYDYPDTKEEGYGIASLPDGGFAVCGRVHGTHIQRGKAWVLRTDAQGDTLWTDVWGTSNSNWGHEIALNNNELCILAKGEDDTLTTHGCHLLFYDLEGDYLRGTDHPDYSGQYPASICATSNGGYTFVDDEYPVFCHTDYQGEVLWMNDDIYISPNERHKGYCVRETMDGGYIFCGWDGWYYVPGEGFTDYEEGWLVRLDSEGNELWNINNYAGDHHAYYSCLQLPEGGYIACGAFGVFEDPPLGESRGTTGYLVRYAPETGISEPESALSPGLEVSPNPCASLLSLTFSLVESGVASISIYDLSGRLIDTVADEVFPAGENTVGWAVPEDVSSGCYLIQYNSASGSISERCALVN